MATTPQDPTNGPGKHTNRTPRAKAGPKAPVTEHMMDQIPIQDPDAVQKGIIDVWGWVEDNVRWLAAVLAIIVIAGIAHVVTHAIWDHQEKIAQTAFAAVETKYTKLKEGFDRAKYKALMPTAPVAKAAANEAPATGDLAKDYGSTITDLEAVARKYDGTAAGAQAALLAGQTYLDYKQPEKAAELAQLPAKSLSKTTLLSELSRIMWGSALATKGDCAAAVKVWEEILDNKSASYLHGEASLRSGICYESMNQPDKAAEMYRKVSADGAAGNAAGSAEATTSSTAKGLLRALEVRSKTAPQKG